MLTSTRVYKIDEKIVDESSLSLYVSYTKMGGLFSVKKIVVKNRSTGEEGLYFAVIRRRDSNIFHIGGVTLPEDMDQSIPSLLEKQKSGAIGEFNWLVTSEKDIFLLLGKMSEGVSIWNPV